MRVADLKISIRLMLGFALMGLLILALGAVTLIKSASIHGSFTQVTDETIPNVEKLNTLVAELGQAGFAIRDAALIREAAQVEEGEGLDERDRRIRAAHEKIQQTLKQLGETIHDPRALQLLERIKAGGTTYVEAEQAFMSQVQLALPTAEIATYLFNTVRPALDAYLAPVQELLQLQTELRDQAVQAARDDMRALSVAVWVSGLLALVAGTLLAWWIIRAITGPLRRAVQVSRAVAGGRLTDQIEPQGNNETGLLLNAQRDMIEQLRDVVTRVRQGSESVATASGQITQANLDLSSRTEEQASALQQTAASMEQLSSTVQQNANSAQQANQLAQSATQVAGRGGAAVDEVVHTMRGIQESSQRIADIIGVIDGIAFQTNILALNAAVEAARAGEQGRGFAVVAGEVRVLAQRSAEAAKEIKQLIDTSVQRVAAGTAQVDRAGETMKEVVQSIQQVTDLMGEISTASQEQSRGVTQVGEAMTQMDQITQQNAALVEEMAASAHSLQGQAHELVQAVTVFTLGGEDQTIPDGTPSSGDAPQAALESAPAQRPGKSRLRLTAT